MKKKIAILGSTGSIGKTLLNILLKEKFIPELFQNDANEDNIYKIISNYINHLN